MHLARDSQLQAATKKTSEFAGCMRQRPIPILQSEPSALAMLHKLMQMQTPCCCTCCNLPSYSHSMWSSIVPISYHPCNSPYHDLWSAWWLWLSDYSTIHCSSSIAEECTVWLLCIQPYFITPTNAGTLLLHTPHSTQQSVHLWCFSNAFDRATLLLQAPTTMRRLWAGGGIAPLRRISRTSSAI